MADRKNKNKKVNKMTVEEVRALMLKMQNDGHTGMKKYEHLQKRLNELNRAKYQRELAT